MNWTVASWLGRHFGKAGGGMRRADRRAESICDKQELFNLAEARDCEGPVENEAPCCTRFCWMVNSLFSRQRGGPNCLSAYQKKKKTRTKQRHGKCTPFVLDEVGEAGQRQEAGRQARLSQ